MGSFSIWHWLIVLAVVLVLFGGGGKIPRLMKDLGSGINQFKRGLKEEREGESDSDTETKALDKEGDSPVASKSEDNRPAEESKKAASG